MPAIQHQDAQIWYQDAGSGPPVLLVHGGLFEPLDGDRFWVQPGVVEDLQARGYRLLVPDRRFAAGRTSAPYGAHSWEVEARDLLAVLQAAGEQSAHVVAGSNGCSAALWLLLLAPEVLRSLVLCWPAAPANAQLADAFAISAAYVADHGPQAYLDLLQGVGLPRPGETRPGLPWGVALLRDQHTVETFLRQPAQQAAAVMRTTASALLAGKLLRGISTAQLSELARARCPISIMPAEPENVWHPRQTALQLAAALPGSRLVEGFPETPTSRFPASRPAFSARLGQLLTA